MTCYSRWNLLGWQVMARHTSSKASNIPHKRSVIIPSSFRTSHIYDSDTLSTIQDLISWGVEQLKHELRLHLISWGCTLNVYIQRGQSTPNTQDFSYKIRDKYSTCPLYLVILRLGNNPIHSFEMLLISARHIVWFQCGLMYWRKYCTTATKLTSHLIMEDQT